MQKTSVVTTSDLDGSPDASTHEFGIDRVTYEIDLTFDQVLKLRDALAPYVAAGRKVGTTAAAGAKVRGQASARARARREYLDKVRAWARDNGFPDLSAYGKVPEDVIKSYEKAHAGASEALSSPAFQEAVLVGA